MKTLSIYITFLLFLVTTFSSAQNKELIQAIKKEVDRNKNELKIGSLPSPFFIGYNMVESTSIDIITTLGGIVKSEQKHFRVGFSHLLVGDYIRNNHGSGTDYTFAMGGVFQKELPIDNNPEGIARKIWQDLDNKYKNETKKMEAKIAFLQRYPLSPTEEVIPDFEQTVSRQLYLETPAIKIDKEYWENYAKEASEIFRHYPFITNSTVSITASNDIYYYYNTEGAETIVPRSYYKVHINAVCTTADKQDFEDSFFYEYSRFEDIPDLKTIQNKCVDIAQYIAEVIQVPAINETYRGPILIEKMALAEMFQDIFFLNGILTAKRKSDFLQIPGNPNEMMHNRKIISQNLSVTALSGTEEYKGKRLDGYYPIDDQGVKPPQELTLIEDGILKNMLTDRTPTSQYPSSNGHGRLSLRYGEVKVLPGNARLSSNLTCSNQDLRKKLIATIKEEGLPYGYIIRRMRGNVPLAIYRIYTDGHEERVRNTAISGLQLKSFDRILGASDKEFIHNTYWFGVFATYIVPESILFEEMEIVPNRTQNINTPYLTPRPQ